MRALARRAGRPATPNELAKHFGLPPTHVVDHARTLERLGAIEVVRDGYAPLGPPGTQPYRLSPHWIKGAQTRVALVEALAKQRGSRKARS